jgi:hypothetical protein
MIGKNGSCDSWLLGMEFRPSGGLAGSATWRWGIPAGGHLSRAFTIDAQDGVAGVERAVFGTVGGRVRAVKIRMNKGEPLVVRPKLPPRQLRKQFVWLRNMRYFIRFYSAGHYANKVSLYSADGKLIEMLSAIEGEFSGPGV